MVRACCDAQALLPYPLRPDAPERFLRLSQRIFCGCVFARQVGELRFDGRAFNFEFRQRLRYALLLRAGMLDGVVQRRRGVDGRKHLATSGLDVGFQPLDSALGARMSVLRGREHGGRGIALFSCARQSLSPLDRRTPRRPLASLEIPQLGLELLGSRIEHDDLLLAELDVLLPAVDVEFARVGGLTGRGGSGFRFGKRDAGDGELVLDGGQMRRRNRLLPTARLQSFARRTERRRHASMATDEQDFFPTLQLVAQTAVAPGPCSLPLEHASLFVDFEDDVVDTGQVVLGRLQLELGGPPPCLVLGDSGGFLNQLPPVGGTRAQDEANLSLLDNRVGLGPQAGVHEQIVNVAEAACLAVDQVLALARPVQASRQLDDPPDVDERIRIVIGGLPIPGRRAMTVRPFGDRCDFSELQPHFRRAGRLAGVAAAENHVFHAIAAQALGALLAQYPRDRVGDVALAAAIGPDDGGDAAVERQLGRIREGFEARDFESLKSHGSAKKKPLTMTTKKRRHLSGWNRPKVDEKPDRNC